MRKPIVGLVVAAVAIAAPAPATAQPSQASTLPPGPGHDTVVKVCSACHAPEIAATQRLTPAGWDELVETMVGRGAQASDAEVAEIKAYLSKSFPAEPAKSAAKSQ
ncbi:c-type cytochrome [Sphingomonas crusticola]|uniref:c-type cytochrome n=1 Tax=Sphingomonas crusticola TaxID=1697973 RepID=UPI0013C2E723|nr:cytochrome c [Sphingomonas crusticola]